jgi:4-oxalomesaconate tautomerase
VTSQMAIRCSVFRGGTSKGLYFHFGDLPSDRETRDAVLLAAMGSPDAREIDGMGGGHPLTSKVALVRRSEREDADVDYLFLQVWPDRAEVADNQNCGNLLAGVGPFAIEEGLVVATSTSTDVRIWMMNTSSLAVATVRTPKGRVLYEGDAHIDGVPGTHAPINIEFLDVAGSTCGSLLPTGNVVDVLEGIRVTCIDNGMPVVCLAAEEVGLSGYEEPSTIESNESVCELVERVRLAAGPIMNLGDVTNATVPKMCLLAKSQHGGAISTRTFIPKRVHDSIGVFGALSVATACLLTGSVAADIATLALNEHAVLDIEHPSGYFSVTLDVQRNGEQVVVEHAALVRTARLLMRGDVFVPSAVWPDR